MIALVISDPQKLLHIVKMLSLTLSISWLEMMKVNAFVIMTSLYIVQDVFASSTNFRRFGLLFFSEIYFALLVIW